MHFALLDLACGDSPNGIVCPTSQDAKQNGELRAAEEKVQAARLLAEEQRQAQEKMQQMQQQQLAQMQQLQQMALMQKVRTLSFALVQAKLQC